MSTAIESLPIQFASLQGKARIPSWAKSWNVSTLNKIQATEIKPGIVVIQSRAPSELMKQGQYLLSWSKAATAINHYVVVAFAKSTQSSADELAEVLKLFPNTRQVEFANGTAHLKESLTQSVAKYLVYDGAPKGTAFTKRKKGTIPPKEPLPAAPKTATDALGEAREVIAALRPLLAPSGRLSALRVAELFGLSTAKLGRLIGSSRQALAKTPDSAAIQDGLRPFERVARLRAILSQADFRAWLNRANQHLDDQTPMQIIESGRAGVAADLVESMLTGAPS